MDWKSGSPPVLVGERVVWTKNDEKRPGIVRWIGNISGTESDAWSVGLVLDKPLTDGSPCDGFWNNRKLFECPSGHGIIVPVEQIEKSTSKISPSRRRDIEDHSGQILDGSQSFGEFRGTDLKDGGVKRSTETKSRNRYSALESKLSEWGLRYPDSARKDNSDDKTEEKRNKKQEKSNENSLRQHHIKSKLQGGKLSLKKKARKRKSFHEYQYKSPPARKFEEDLELVRKSLDKCSYFTINEAFVPPKNSNGKMNDVTGFFKQIKEEDILEVGTYVGKENEWQGTSEKQLGQLLTLDLQSCETAPKEKKLFSFLKWFKKNKENSTLKNFKDSSVASSPVFQRRRNSSCESIDTLFSTQTVRSFAYIPPQQYQPSAPPSSLLEFDKDVFDERTHGNENKPKNAEPVYDRKKKRRAPGPPRLTRENSLPTTLEHKKKDNELEEGSKTFHRRTVSESFKDKKAGAYCHVQGKRKAPLPPPNAPSIYPNLQKLNNQYQSLQKKKKSAPPPPIQGKTNRDTQNAKREETDKAKETATVSESVKSDASDKATTTNGKPDGEEQSAKVSLSPLPSRPWYKRSHRDSGGSSLIKKDILKGFERKKNNKETEEWMPEVGYPRRSLSGDSHSKFNIFARLDKHDEKKKEEKRKSQISILTNISELDKEAAEIVRKEQAEEKKMLAENDEKYYTAEGSPNSFNLKSAMPNGVKEEGNQGQGPTIPNEMMKKDPRESKGSPKIARKDPKGKAREIPMSTEAHDNITNQTGYDRPKTDSPVKINIPDANEKTKPNSSASNLPGEDVTASPKAPTSNLNHFDVKNKEVYYINEPWVCGNCTLENAGWRVFCEICASVKPRFLYNGNVKESPEKKNTNGNADKNKRGSEQPKQTKGEDKDEEEAETLEELRKKRTNFFAAKLANQEQSDVTTESDKTDLKQIIKERKESLPKKEEQVQGNVTQNGKDEKAKPEGLREPVKPNLSNGVEAGQENSNSQDGKYGAVKKRQNPTDKKDKVVEAYVITKTTILEDIIIKKGDKGDREVKVSTGAQTKSDDQGLRAPPRTKKPETSQQQMPGTSQSSANPLPLPEGTSQEDVRKLRQDLEDLAKRLTRAEGLADFKATVRKMAPDTGMNTVAVNKIMKKLETAINEGDHFVAAGLAKDLALMKINCSVRRHVTDEFKPKASTSKITVDMYLEDKVSHQGPIKLEVSPSMTLLQLKEKVQQEMGIPMNLQRWILDKRLATDDNKTLESDGVKNNSCSIFLYLVAPENRELEINRTVLTGTTPVTQPARQNKEQTPVGNGSNEFHHNLRREAQSNNLEEATLNESPDMKGKSKDVRSPQSREANGSVGILPMEASESGENKNKTEGQPDARRPIFNILRDEQNDVEKELKLVTTANSVKQKVEQLNKTFAQNSKADKFNMKSSDGWKCSTCTYVNSRARVTCFACSAKKSEAKSEAPRIPKLEPAPIPAAPARHPEVNDINKIHYRELVELQDSDLVPNIEPFNCSICMVDYSPGEGVILKDCLHTFCRPCLINTVQYSEDAEVKCPYMDETYSCLSVLQQREIKALVPQKIFESHLAKSVKEAENKIGNAFHCKTPDCRGWCVYEDNVNVFHCPVCKLTNCLTCHAIHTGINCREFQERMKDASETDADAMKTRIMLEEMVQKGEAMACPKCQVVLMKKWGCDWLRCSMCKTEICWVTRGFRWGPSGKGDTSGGCKCGVNGVKCHPKCNYCH